MAKYVIFIGRFFNNEQDQQQYNNKSTVSECTQQRMHRDRWAARKYGEFTAISECIKNWLNLFIENENYEKQTQKRKKHAAKAVLLLGRIARAIENWLRPEQNGLVKEEHILWTSTEKEALLCIKRRHIASVFDAIRII